MGKIKTVLTTISFLAVSLLMFAQIALADLLPINGSRPNISPEPKTFIDLIEPQHVVIGGAVLAVVIISFTVLSKMRKK